MIASVKSSRCGARVRNEGFKRSAGFTLIELMIVIAIVAILAAVAYPSYLDSIRAARRADAMDGLLTLMNQQEKYRANNTLYGTMLQITGNATATSSDGYYTLTVTGNSATAYTLKATAVSGSSQAHDTGCTIPTLTVSAGNPRGVKTPAACWKK
ncbi:hypothetical protein A9Q89_12240 [Gammaproteobacteria bacterium 53_120_T64]|nr:hypothetical protein A9Q89_12240 [Gammaproteobacteria bacterium 53_120_T64]